jgi:hypothetical protein
MAVNVDTRRHVNDHRRRLFGRATGPIAFVCECDDDGCTTTVRLSQQEFDRARDAHGRVLDPRHTSAPVH